MESIEQPELYIFIAHYNWNDNIHQPVRVVRMKMLLPLDVQSSGYCRHRVTPPGKIGLLGCVDSVPAESGLWQVILYNHNHYPTNLYSGNSLTVSIEPSSIQPNRPSFFHDDVGERDFFLRNF
jgi:hypothetical protein